LDAEIKLAEAQKLYGTRTTVHELKELNLRTEKEPCPIYVNTILTTKEEEEYSKHLFE